MHKVPVPHLTLSGWLERLESQHPTEIDLGLDRVLTVAEALGVLCEGFLIYQAEIAIKRPYEIQALPTGSKVMAGPTSYEYSYPEYSYCPSLPNFSFL